MAKTKFDPSAHLTDIKGKKYLEVKWRLVWVREEHPDWQIKTEIVERVEGGVIAKATILDGEGQLLATAHKMETKQGFPDYLEKAETGAVGRALALCGYGTQFAPELDEGTERIVDAPVAAGGNVTVTKAGNGVDSTNGNKATWKQADKIRQLYGSHANEVVGDWNALTKERASELISTFREWRQAQKKAEES